MKAKILEKQRGFSGFATLSGHLIRHPIAAAITPTARESTNRVGTSAISNVVTPTASLPRQQKVIRQTLQPPFISKLTLRNMSRIASTNVTSRQTFNKLEMMLITYPGIYLMTIDSPEKTTSVVYIGVAGGDGITANMASCIKNELADLYAGKHHNKFFQHAFNANPKSCKSYIFETGPHLTDRKALRAAEANYIKTAEFEQPFMTIGDKQLENVILTNLKHVEFPITEADFISHFGNNVG